MALKDQPYLPLYTMDFMTDEKLINCSAESTGVYIRLLCVLHKMDEYGVMRLKEKDKICSSKISSFAKKLARYMPYDISVIERSLAELVDEAVITIEEDKLYQKRMVKDAEISEKRVLAGMKGQRACQSKMVSKSEKFAAAKPSANTENEIEYENINKDIDKKDIIKDRFDIFWKAYPRKAGKGEAEKVWKKIAPNKELFDKITGAVESAKQTSQWKKDNGQFIPYPATWLRQKRWEDDYGVTRTAEGANPFSEWEIIDG